MSVENVKCDCIGSLKYGYKEMMRIVKMKKMSKKYKEPRYTKSELNGRYLLEKEGNQVIKVRREKYALHAAVFDGRVEDVRDLINGGVDLEEGDDCGGTALLYAVIQDNAEVCKLLLGL